MTKKYRQKNLFGQEILRKKHEFMQINFYR